MKLTCTKHLAYRIGENCARCGRSDPSPEYERKTSEELDEEELATVRESARERAEARDNLQMNQALGIATGAVVMADALQLHAPHVPPVPCEEPLPSNRFAGLVAKNKTALYFGDYGKGGHYLRSRAGIIYRPEIEYPGFPWSLAHLDTGLLKNRKSPDVPDGRVHWTCGGTTFWLAFFWWDRSGDRRSNSGSGFYVQGFAPDDAQAAFDFACAQWSEVVARQAFPLVLVDRDLGFARQIPKSG